MYTHTHTHTHKHAQHNTIHTCTHNTHTHTHTHTHTNTHAHTIHTHTHTHKYTCTRAYTWAHNTHTHRYTHAHSHTSINNLYFSILWTGVMRKESVRSPFITRGLLKQPYNTQQLKYNIYYTAHVDRSFKIFFPFQQLQQHLFSIIIIVTVNSVHCLVLMSKLPDNKEWNLNQQY